METLPNESHLYANAAYFLLHRWPFLIRFYSVAEVPFVNVLIILTGNEYVLYLEIMDNAELKQII